MRSRILVADRYGQSDVLDFVEEELPALTPGQARIAVKAAGLNPIDARRMTGEIRFGPLPLRFGTEFAGRIVELPAEAGPWSVGDEVLGSGGGFTHATIIDVPIGNLIRRPSTVDWPVAGSLAGTAQTAMAVVQELGDIGSLLVHGGAGGVGTVLVQLAREKGIEVVATDSGANPDYLRALGATPVAYGPGLVERLREVHPAPFDAAIILAGTEEATHASLATVKPDGDIASTTGIPAPSERVRATGNRPSPANLQYVVDRVADGRIRWEVSGTYPFAKAAEGFAAVLEGHTRGKRVLIF
ncbi:NADP-dependent oxidoreductase [Paracoccus spongiarum]|uniref:NADP-dependent oxidoreductase n=1 Tax=Paracoccus spongiarum TaxID=3064387 RepID=A0ABT9J902_9RHOB|nr:NADP-dependent oxidoreductase [Paracoccus sp. 2205BS29-5]MDP5306284.1 NADP-dependent oxidoreductase [Paracoccus sp. 2205BS29-5]